MTRPRSSFISMSDTPWHHIVNRCVRRAFLCGIGPVTGVSFDHRRGWIETRIRELASVFTIDVAAYAVMSNHYHVVLRIDQGRAVALSDDAVRAAGHSFSQGRCWCSAICCQRIHAPKWAKAKAPKSKSLPGCIASACLMFRGLCGCSMNPLPAKPMRKTTAPVGFGKGVSKARHRWTNKRCWQPWPMWT